MFVIPSHTLVLVPGEHFDCRSPMFQALYGVSELAELQFRVRNFRREIAERRAFEKAEDKAAAAAKRKAVS